MDLLQKNRATTKSFGNLIVDLSDQQLKILCNTEYRKELKLFLNEIIELESKNLLYEPVYDQEAMALFDNKLLMEFRILACKLSYTGPIAWVLNDELITKDKIKKIMYLKTVVDLADELRYDCGDYGDFRKLLFIPQYLESKIISESMDSFLDPEKNILINSITVPWAVMALLIYSYKTYCGDKIPLQGKWVRILDGNQKKIFALGDHNFEGLKLDEFEPDEVGNLGCFPILVFR